VIAYHLQPPAAQREGGLDAAIQGLCAALTKAGIAVEMTLPRELAAGSVVHLHGLWQRAYPAAARQCRAQNIPYIVSPHGMLEPWAWQHKRWKKWPYFIAIERRLLKGAAALLATAEEEAQRLRDRALNQRVEVLALGLTGEARPAYASARQRLQWAPEERVLLFLSRIHPKKGLELLLEALARKNLPGPLRLVIVGDGLPEYVARVKSMASSLAERLPPIDWIGPVWGEQRWSYFQGADLFCLPTYSENFGLAVLEALQVGTPVLTTSTTPWASQLQHPHGFICDPEVTSVVRALQYWWEAPKSDQAARADLSQWTYSRYAWNELAEPYVSFYQSLRA
jgi:glycosyltransferase involved in cell wall biosynthesis